MCGEYFRNLEEMFDLIDNLRVARRQGAVAGGIFGSRLNKGGWEHGSDLDVVIDDPAVGPYGEVDFIKGKRSGSWLHVFRRNPNLDGGLSRREDILDTANKTKRNLF